MEGVVRHFDSYWNSGWAFPVRDLVHLRSDAPGLKDARVFIDSQTGSVSAPDSAGLQSRWIEAARNGHPGMSVFYSDAPAQEDPAAESEAPNQLAAALLELIDAATSEVILVSAYLIPTPELEAAIERAEERGVQVRILTNSLRSNNHLPAHSAYRGHIRRLVSHGAELHEVRAEAADRPRYMQEPVGDKRLGLHAKMLVIDQSRVYVGSCNLDPRSLKLNTEVGLVVDSRSLNRALRDATAADFEPRNAWTVKLSDAGRLQWHGDGEVLDGPPSDSPVQALEDWFLGLLPIEQQM